jgi:sporulation protein YlmC with PRC-barrel domain
MKPAIVVASTVILMSWAFSATAQVAGSATVGVTVAEMKEVVLGWSAKQDLLGKSVINDDKAKIGSVDDIIVSPKKTVSYAIVGVGGFLGVGKHDVAIPMEQLKLEDGRLILPGANKETLKGLPKFEYAPKSAKKK